MVRLCLSGSASAATKPLYAVWARSPLLRTATIAVSDTREDAVVDAVAISSRFGSGRVQTGESVRHPKSYICGVRLTPATFLCRRGRLVNGAQVARSPVAELPAPHLPPKQMRLRSCLFLSVGFLPCPLCLRFIRASSSSSIDFLFLVLLRFHPRIRHLSVAHRFDLFSAGIQSQTDFSCGVTDLQDRISLT